MILRHPLKTVKITQGFGVDFIWDNKWFYKDIYGLAGHPGLDYKATIPLPLYSAHNGVCLYSGFDNTNGNMIQIWNEAENYKTLYGHLSERKVNQGDMVVAGQEIGMTGNTGAGTGPHLHFGLKHTKEGGNSLVLNDGFNGAIDPTPYLTQDYLGNNLIKKDMVFKKIKGESSVYLVDDVKGTKMMVIDMETLNALNGVIEEVPELAGYIDRGTLVWVDRIIN